MNQFSILKIIYLFTIYGHSFRKKHKNNMKEDLNQLEKV